MHMQLGIKPFEPRSCRARTADGQRAYVRACSARVISDHVALHAWMDGSLLAWHFHCLVRSVVGRLLLFLILIIENL